MENKTTGNFRWTICALLFFATTINYLDRQVLSLLHPILEKEFGWSYSDYGLITAVFQISYAIFMLFAGRIVDKLGTKKGFSIAIIVWSLGAMLHAYAIEIGEASVNVLGILGISGLSVSVVGFIIARLVLGLGESANFPAAIKATAEYFPKKERALATGIFNSGANVGAILAPLTVPWLAYTYGWQASFIIVGSLGFIWLIFYYIYFEVPQKQKRLSKSELEYITSDTESEVQDESTADIKISWLKLLTFKQTWAFSLGKFMTDGVWWFFLFWLPSYLTGQFGLSGTEITIPLTVLYTMTMIGSVSGGILPMYFIKKGNQPYEGRLKAMFIIALFPLLTLLFIQPLSHISYCVPVVLIGIAASAHQAWSANMYNTVTDMFPKPAVGSVIGIIGMSGGIGGALVSYFAGRIFDHYKLLGNIESGYFIVFLYGSLAYVAAWCVMKVLVPKTKMIKLSEL